MAKPAPLGETAIEVIVFVVAVMLNVALPLMPLSEALTVVEPAATPVGDICR